MHSENSITIDAPPARIYDLAAHIERWPDILPHYRYVTLYRDDGHTRLVEMAATRDGGFPVKWTSIEELDPTRHKIHFRHVRGITRGMVVEWIIEPGPGGTDVRIVHDFNPPWPAIVGPLFARYIVGDFIHNIANKTLRTIKGLAEADQQQLNVV
jgi:uncharacterized membrane protein